MHRETFLVLPLLTAVGVDLFTPLDLLAGVIIGGLITVTLWSMTSGDREKEGASQDSAP